MVVGEEPPLDPEVSVQQRPRSAGVEQQQRVVFTSEGAEVDAIEERGASVGCPRQEAQVDPLVGVLGRLEWEGNPEELPPWGRVHEHEEGDALPSPHGDASQKRRMAQQRVVLADAVCFRPRREGEVGARVGAGQEGGGADGCSLREPPQDEPSW